MQLYTSSVPGRSMCDVGEFVELSILGGYIGEAWHPKSNVSFSPCSHLDSIYTETFQSSLLIRVQFADTDSSQSYIAKVKLNNLVQYTINTRWTRALRAIISCWKFLSALSRHDFRQRLQLKGSDLNTA